VEFRILGPVEARAGGRPIGLGSRKQRLVLAILLLAANRPVPRERLIDLLWPHDPPASATNTLQALVSRLRSALRPFGPDAPEIVSEGSGYLIRMDPLAVDAHRFTALCARAAVTDDEQAVTLLDEALALWHGDPLAGAASGEVAHRLCGSLTEARWTAVEDRLDAQLRLGRGRQVLAKLTGLVAAHPLRQRLVGQLMLALHHEGRTDEALEAYQALRVRLGEELGLDPAPDLRRLQSRILASEPDPAPEPPAVEPRPAQLPHDIPGFAGRETALAALDDDMTGASLRVISGMAGVGKTVLAVHWAHRVADRFPDGQLYVNLRGFDPDQAPVDPPEVVRRFLDALGVPAQRVPVGLDAQAALYRSVLAERRMLVLLDNAADADQVRPLLPGAGGCLVIVTSRDRLTGLAVADGARPLNLELPSVVEARELLVNRLGRERVLAEPAAAEEIIARCARLPLALAVVAARAVVNPGFALAALADDLRAEGTGLDAFDGEDLVTSVRAVFSWSYRRLSEQAATLYRLLGLHTGPDIGISAAASLAGVPTTAVRSQLAELTRAHLLTEHVPGRFGSHDLLHAYAAELARTHDTTEDREAAVGRVLDHYLHTAHAADRVLRAHRDPIPLPPARPGVVPETPADLSDALTWFGTEQAVLVAAVTHAATHGFAGQAWRLATTLADFLGRGGRWDVQAALHETALDAAVRSTDRSGQAYAHIGLAHALAWLGRSEDAETHYASALALFGELDNVIGQAHVEMGLGLMFEQQNRIEDALSHSTGALELFRAASHTAGQGNALNNIGWLLAQRGEHEQALTYCRAALDLLTEVDDFHSQANVWDSIGYLNHQLGRHAEAIAYHQRALELFREVGDEFYVADTLVHLGSVHADTGDHEFARRTWLQALDILDELRHPDAEDVRAKLRELDRRTSRAG
jgi:DNA-binding SARP family transcriptional activator